MKGLFIKDIYNLKQQVKIYLLLIAVWMVMGYVNNDSTFFSGVMMIFSLLIPVTSIAYDEKANWDKYALTMPVTKNEIVLSKYILSFFCAVISFVCSSAVGIVLTKNAADSLVTSLVFMSLGIILTSVVLPVIIKFGVEKGRMIMLAIFLVPTIVGMILPKLNLEMPQETTIEQILYLSPLVAAFCAVVSILISIKIYNKKEL